MEFLVSWSSTISLVNRAHSWHIELNARREILNLRVPMYYSLFIQSSLIICSIQPPLFWSKHLKESTRNYYGFTMICGLGYSNLVVPQVLLLLALFLKLNLPLVCFQALRTSLVWGTLNMLNVMYSTWEAARVPKKWGETLDYMYFSGFPLHFLRALAASSVLYNRTEYKKVFWFYQLS